MVLDKIILISFPVILLISFFLVKNSKKVLPSKPDDPKTKILISKFFLHKSSFYGIF